MSIIQSITKDQLRADIPADIEIGDTVRVHISIKDEKGEKDRAQVFEGVVMRWRRGGIGSTITVRKVSHGVGVERVFPIHSPAVARIELKAKGVVRRARLYYLRDLSGKAARIKARTTAKK